jgi:hypothetical protein
LTERLSVPASHQGARPQKARRTNSAAALRTGTTQGLHGRAHDLSIVGPFRDQVGRAFRCGTSMELDTSTRSAGREQGVSRGLRRLPRLLLQHTPAAAGGVKSPVHFFRRQHRALYLCPHQRLSRPDPYRSQQPLGLREGLFAWIEVGRVARLVERFATFTVDRLADLSALWAKGLPITIMCPSLNVVVRRWPTQGSKASVGSSIPRGPPKAPYCPSSCSPKAACWCQFIGTSKNALCPRGGWPPQGTQWCRKGGRLELQGTRLVASGLHIGIEY